MIALTPDDLVWESNGTFCAPKDIKPVVKYLYLAQLVRVKSLVSSISDRTTAKLM